MEQARPSSARFLYLRFSRNYLYLFYLYIFPIRSGNVLINFLRTFAEAFYTQGFIYTKKLPKLTLASTCLCLNNRNIFLKTISIWKECCCDNEGHHHHFCQAFFALKFALFNVYLSFKYTLNFIFYKEIKTQLMHFIIQLAFWISSRFSKMLPKRNIMHYYLEEAQTITRLHLIYRPLYVVLSGHRKKWPFRWENDKL